MSTHGATRCTDRTDAGSPPPTDVAGVDRRLAMTAAEISGVLLYDSRLAQDFGKLFSERGDRLMTGYFTGLASRLMLLQLRVLDLEQRR